MTSIELPEACERLVRSLASADDVQPVVDAAALLAHPPGDVVGWLGSAVLQLAEGRAESELIGVTSRRMPDLGAVARVVSALRSSDLGRARQVLGSDPVDAFVLLGAVAAALLGASAG
ncbi:hypothetical protein [Nocardioides immobilis]|uniref:hypothetical protein n=1 Tax=Nocardioides immobilis TaxID=2049295 RepID=UPI0011C4A3FB|nr:hypothetical protein [Nocardioides immobilis]